MEEMDLGDWELLPRSDDADDGDEDGVITRRRNPNPNPRSLFDKDYFICPSQDPPKQTQLHRRSGVVPTQLLQVPMAWEPIFSTDDSDHHKTKEEKKATTEVSVVVVPAKTLMNPDPGLLADPVPSPQVSFKRMKEPEFVDMKIDPTRVVTSPLPQIDVVRPLDSDDRMRIGSEGEDGDLLSKKDDWDSELIQGNGGDQKLNLWKLGLTGIGAICSFGVAAAAATICVFLFGNNGYKNDDKSCRNKNQMLRFQIYSDDKGMEEVVQHATKLNEAISVMKGVPVVRAQISLGGYYNPL